MTGAEHCRHDQLGYSDPASPSYLLIQRKPIAILSAEVVARANSFWRCKR